MPQLASSSSPRKGSVASSSAASSTAASSSTPTMVTLSGLPRPYSALTTGERAVRRAYVQRERARLAARRRAALARTISAIVPAQRGPHLP